MTIDIKIAKEAARGKWATIAGRVFGIPDDYLTSKQGPCPKCRAGVDRWRTFSDFEETGGAMCNQCGKSADGFALGQWFLDIPLNDTIQKVCDFLGVVDEKKSGKSKPSTKQIPTQAGNSKRSSIDALEFRPWNDRLFDRWASTKKPISEAAVKLAGGQFAKYHGTMCIAIPVIGRDGKTPSGYALYNATGGPILHRASKDAPLEYLKVKLVGCSKESGWMGRFQPGKETIKTEGVSDMLAVLSANPDASVISNPFGAGENPMGEYNQWMLKQLQGETVYTIHDTDKPGQEGALLVPILNGKELRPGWATAIAIVAKESRNVVLPIQGEGKDIRDFINSRVEQGRTLEQSFAELKEIAKSSPSIEKPEGVELAFEENKTKSKDDRIVLKNFITKKVENEDGSTSLVDEPIPIVDIAKEIFELTGGWPKRNGPELFVLSSNNPQPRTLEKPTSLTGWLRENFEVNWKQGSRLPTKEELYEIVPHYCEIFDSVEQLPHFPRIAGVFYTCEDRPAGNGNYLEKFLDFFSPSTPIDRQLLLSAIATTFWGGPPGARPGFQFGSTSGQGAGKSTAASLILELSGGSIDFEQNCKREDITLRLLNGEAGCRGVFLDNIKAKSYGNASIESLITSKSISGKKHYLGNGSKPNRYTFFVTFNSAVFSRDMAQRLVSIILGDSKKSGDWQSNVEAFISNHRNDLVDDIKAFFERPAKQLSRYNRWGTWQRDILSRLEDPDSIAEELASRESCSDDDAKMASDILDFTSNYLIDFGYSSPYRVHIGFKEMGLIVAESIGSPHTPREAGLLIDRFISSKLISNMQRNPCHKHGKGFLLWSAEGNSKNVCYELKNKIEQREILNDNAKQRRQAEARKGVY